MWVANTSIFIAVCLLIPLLAFSGKGPPYLWKSIHHSNIKNTYFEYIISNSLSTWSFCRFCTWSQLCSFSPCLSSFLATPAVSFQKKPISYSLLINPSSLFSISAETGEISLTRPIDYESDQHRYLLLVRASEGIESMSSAAEVCVYIYIYICMGLCMCMLVSLRCKFQEKKSPFWCQIPWLHGLRRLEAFHICLLSLRKSVNNTSINI